VPSERQKRVSAQRGLDKYAAHARNRHRHEFAGVASRLSGEVLWVGAAPLMCRPGWVPDHPIRAPVGFGSSPVSAPGRPG